MEKEIPLFTDIFIYDNGKLYWKYTFGPRSKQGNQAGGVSTSTGYRRVLVRNKRWLEHRIIFYIHHGYLPCMIDHINGDKEDNRIENLREVTQGLNRANSLVNYNSKTKYKGVDYRKGRGFRVRVQGKDFGMFKTALEAARAYDLKAKELFGEFARLNMEE